MNGTEQDGESGDLNVVWDELRQEGHVENPHLRVEQIGQRAACERASSPLIDCWLEYKVSAWVLEQLEADEP